MGHAFSQRTHLKTYTFLCCHECLICMNILHTCIIELYRREFWDFPGSPVVKTPRSQRRGHGFDPSSGKILHAAWRSQKRREFCMLKNWQYISLYVCICIWKDLLPCSSRLSILTGGEVSGLGVMWKWGGYPLFGRNCLNTRGEAPAEHHYPRRSSISVLMESH